MSLPDSPGTGATTTTAHQHWDSEWSTETGRAMWSRPDPWVAGVLPALRERDTRRVLDLGCGPGRHALLFARAGLASHAVDAGPAALDALRAAAVREGLAVEVRQDQMSTLPYQDNWFDYVLAFNVIYHGTGHDAAQALAEVRRVLRPGGLFQATMLSKHNSSHAVGTQIAPDTYVREDADDDKTHPHLYTDAADLLELFQGFDVLQLVDRVQSSPGSHHWYCLFEKPGAGT